MSKWLLGCELFVVTLLLSLILVPLAKQLALRLGVVDQPVQRKIHQRPKALLGGLAIFFAFLIAVGLHLGVYEWRDSLFPWLNQWLAPHTGITANLGLASKRLLALLVGSIIIVALGLWDDLRGVNFPVKLKFVGQFLAAGVVIYGGIVTNFMPGRILDVVLTAVWVVGITNSFNLLDNMDGLAAGIAIIAGSLLFFITLQQQQLFTAFLLAVFVGSIGGFLPYNLYPSRLFMGDTGSMFLGFFLGCLTVNSSYITSESPTFVPVIIPLIILAVPLFDTFSVMVIRWRLKQPLFVGDQNHFSHRLVQLGMRQSEAVVFIYVVALAIGLISLLLPGAKLLESIIIVVQTLLFFTIISFLMFVAKARKRPAEKLQTR